MSSGSSLTTTSYALLGLLAIKPWTTYELAQHMDRSVGRLWPRAQSKIYEEPKKLVAHGLATATAEQTGRRRRTVYSITPRGRRALRKWVGSPGSGPVLEFEQLLKVFFAENGTRDDLLQVLETIRLWADDQMAEHASVAASYLAREGPFPQRVAILALTGRFLVDFTEAVRRWAEWAAETVRSWPDDLRDAPPDWSTFEAIARSRSGSTLSRALDET